MTNQLTSAPPANLDAPLDARGFNPDDYQWVPVLRKARVDGWSPEKQRRFIETLADTGSVIKAALAVDMTERSAYKLRRSPGAEGFDRAWSAAIDAASKRLLDEAFERALVGSDEPVFDRSGNRVGRRLRQSDKMLQFLMRAYMPERFGAFANAGDQGGGGDDAVRALASPPVSEALAQLLPETPADPHLLMEEEDLGVALTVADLTDGKLPHWLRDRGVVPEEDLPAEKASTG
jgi:hypothetical protein